MEETYNSCKKVSMPQTGNLAMEFACGLPPELCNYTRYYNQTKQWRINNKIIFFVDGLNIWAPDQMMETSLFHFKSIIFQYTIIITRI